MNTIYDILRHLVEHASWPVDDLKQEAHDLLDRLENFGDEHLAGGQDVDEAPKADPAADAKDAKKPAAVTS
jgi:hypothetical protein